MTGEAPPFWWQQADWRAWALWPLSLAYGGVASRRMVTARREPVAAPVLCVGNLTVGGSGKTPTAIALCKAASARGLRPGVLSRGHGGSHRHAHIVDVAHDSARGVGDEPLLLARHAPVAVTADRAAGARLLIDRGCDFLIMDDGFQSARIHMDFALVVIDARRGTGNGHVIPAGPMRAPLVQQMRFADAVLSIGAGGAADALVRSAARAGKAAFHAETTVLDAGNFAGKRLFAFAGIGDPEKFFETVTAAGGWVTATRGFADHHAYSDEDVAELAAEAAAAQAQLVTTEKDAVRLATGSAKARALAERLAVLRIGLRFEPGNALDLMISATLDAYENRRHGVSRRG